MCTFVSLLWICVCDEMCHTCVCVMCLCVRCVWAACDYVCTDRLPRVTMTRFSVEKALERERERERGGFRFDLLNFTIIFTLLSF